MLALKFFHELMLKKGYVPNPEVQYMATVLLGIWK